MVKINKQKSVELSAAADDHLIIAGLDEAGRGPWAGPIVACAYIEKGRVTRVKIDDSKKLNQAQREAAYELLVQTGDFGVGVAEVEEIDKLGLARANRLAFRRALEGLTMRPDLVLIDGKDKIDPATTLNIPCKTVIKGDSAIRAISCASIIAKVTRDRLMDRLARRYPKYHFEEHKGYGTALHRRLLKQHGACAIHRQSFKPVQMLLQTSLIDE